MNSIFKYAVIFKDERIEIAGFGNYSIETLVSVILEGNAGTSYPYLTDCLREKLEVHNLGAGWRVFCGFADSYFWPDL